MLKNKNTRKKFWTITIIILIILIILSFFAKYLLTKYAEQIQRYIKRSITAKVEAREEELIQVIAEIDSQEIPRYVTLRVKDEDAIPFKELDNDKITKVFKEFSLILIKNDMDNSEGGYVDFAISSDVITYLVWGDYRYGFYYSEEDSPINIVTGAKVDCNTKVYGKLMPYKYWYKTEKITDNWWYYEKQSTYCGGQKW